MSLLDSFEVSLRKRLSERWYCQSPIGLSMEEIGQSTLFWPHELPGVYKRFLSICGQDAGDLFFEYGWKVTDLQRMNERLYEYTMEAGAIAPTSVFAFLDYIGDYFWCFCNSEEDPHVWMFDHLTFSDTNYRLSDFLLSWEQFETPRG